VCLCVFVCDRHFYRCTLNVKVLRSGVWQGVSPEKNNLHVNIKPGSSYTSQRDVGRLGSRLNSAQDQPKLDNLVGVAKDLNVKFPLIHTKKRLRTPVSK